MKLPESRRYNADIRRTSIRNAETYIALNGMRRPGQWP
ncbi:unnamed protein product [Acidocella sp. C78]|nr:unnamed protein product [Acidocella sp. C78]